MSASLWRMTNVMFDRSPTGSTAGAGNVHVIIPARNVAETIAETLRYLAATGLRPGQIHVVVNGCTDETAGVAERTGLATVHDQDVILDVARGSTGSTGIMGSLGLERERIRGKGAAMFIACIMLEECGLAEDAAVVFLDGDIRNIEAVDPVRRLLAAWHARPSTVRLVKLASSGWDHGIRAFLGAHAAYRSLGALEWPLCGQMVVRFGDLRRMRLPTGYAVEMAMLIQLWEEFSTLGVFGEVEIVEPLQDGYSSPHDLITMYVGIMAFMGWFGGGLATLQYAAMCARNRDHRVELYVPPRDEQGPAVLETLLVDALLPSVAELKIQRR